jgi:hypothetical protein
MAESANPNNYGSAFQELAQMVPNQFDGELKFEELDSMLDHEIVFLLLCNSSQFGVSVYQFLHKTEKLDVYIKIRCEMILTLKAIRLDYKHPVLSYKADEFHRMRKALRKLPEQSSEAHTLLWYYDFLSKESQLATKFRMSKLADVPNIDAYSRGAGKRLTSFNQEELAVASRRSQECEYWTQFNKLVTELTKYKSNVLLMFLLLSNSGHTIFADANVNASCVTMVCLLTVEEQDYIVQTLALPVSYDDDKQFNSDTMSEIRKLSPSRFRSDPSFGYKNYTSPANLQILDWIDTDDSDVVNLINSEEITSPSLEGQTREHDPDALVSDSDESLSSRSDDNSDHEADQTTITIPASPETKTKTFKPIGRPTPAPEPTGPPPRTFLTPEQQFLEKQRLQREKAKAEKQLNAKASTSQADTSNPEDVATTSDRLIHNDKSNIDFIISGDACSTILRQIIVRFESFINSGSTRWKQLIDHSSHNERFSVQTTIAKQIVSTELLPTDVLLALCPSINSVRYMITVTKDKRIVLFNRVHHHKWNDWS